MPESEKKRRSGRSREESSDDDEPRPKKKKAAGSSAEPKETLLSPWGPLIWLLIPLFACVAYGLATRGQ
jgi:hypothetical protein